MLDSRPVSGYTESRYFQCRHLEISNSGVDAAGGRTYHRIEKGVTMRDASPGAETAFRDNNRRDAMRWLANQLGWERTLDLLRSQEEDEQAARAA
jgi:hypothetical protein